MFSCTLPLFPSHHLLAKVGPVYLNAVYPSQIQSYFFTASENAHDLLNIPFPRESYLIPSLPLRHTEKLLFLPLNLATTTSLCSQKATEIEYIKLEGTECPPPTAMSQVQREPPLLTVLPIASTSPSLRSFI